MADWVLDALRNIPLISAAAWLLLAALQVYRDRWHTWTETFFLFCCTFAGIYAIGDWLFFNFSGSDPNLAGLYARISLTGITLAVSFFLLFTLVYVDRMRRWYWGLMLLTGAILVMILVFGISHLDPPSAGSQSPLWRPRFNPVPWAVYLGFIGVYALLGIRNLYRLRQIVRQSSKALARRASGLMVTFTLVLVLGLGTNGYIGLADLPYPPPLSTLLIFVAASAYYTLYPIGRERISDAIRRFQARRYSIKAVFLTFEDGTLVGARSRPGEAIVDQDLFGATLDVIQNFMRTSFPILRGKPLKSISHGDYTLVVEPARKTYLTVVLEGEETDQLRRQMRDALLGFEEKNRDVLANWRGMASEAKGTNELLDGFFAEAPPL